MNLAQARSNMIEQQIRPWDVLDQRVLNVIADVARERFVSPEHKNVAYSDCQLPIGEGQVMLPPNVDGRILQALLIETTESVLEIGTGSGYLCACLSRLAAKVCSIELQPTLHEQAKSRLEQLGISNVDCRLQDAAEEWDADDGYDAIALTGSVESIPDFYRNKLVTGGRLFAVVGKPDAPTMEARLLTRVADGQWLEESLFETRIPPLNNFETEPETFQF